MVTLLNSPRLTDYGSFQYQPVTIDEARSWLKNGFQSAIGHPITARFLSDLFSVEVECQRVDYIQQPGEIALVFELKRRPPEGKILELPDIINIGYRFGLLIRIS